MFTISKTFRFEASHQLYKHDGECSQLHGHSYLMDVELSSIALHDSGADENMIVDYGLLGEVVKYQVLKLLDHQHLNKALDTEMPTAEFIAKWVYDKLIHRIPLLKAVTIHETSNTWARYENLED